MQYMTVSLQTCERQRDPLISQILDHKTGRRGIEETIKLCLIKYLHNIVDNSKRTPNVEKTETLSTHSEKALEIFLNDIFSLKDYQINIDVKNFKVKSYKQDILLKKIKIIRDRSNAYLFPRLYEYTKQLLSPTYAKYFEPLTSLDLGQFLELLKTLPVVNVQSIRSVKELFFEKEQKKSVNINSYSLNTDNKSKNDVWCKVIEKMKEADPHINMIVVRDNVQQKAFSLIKTQQFSNAINLEQIKNINLPDTSHIDKIIQIAHRIANQINLQYKIRKSKKHIIYLKNKINHVSNGSKGRVKKSNLNIQLEACTERLRKLDSGLKRLK